MVPLFLNASYFNHCQTKLLPILLLCLLTLAIFQVQDTELNTEADFKVEALFHDTLDVDLDLSAVNPKLTAAIEIWENSVHLRRRNYTVFDTIVRGDNFLQILNYFPPSFICPHITWRIKSGYGAKWVCGLELLKNKGDCVFYSIGASSPYSESGFHEFETELLKQTNNCLLYVYDTNKVKIDPNYRHRMKFKSIEKSNHSNSSKSSSLASKSIPNLELLLKENGHGWLDLLQIDLGPTGLSILEQILQDFDEVLPFAQLQIKLTLQKNRPFDYYVKLLEALEEKGLRQFHSHVEHIGCSNLAVVNELSVEFSFINIRGKHCLQQCLEIFIIKFLLYFYHYRICIVCM